MSVRRADFATQRLVIRKMIGHKAAITIDMKPTIALLSIILTLGLGACSTCKTGTKVVTLVPCCASTDPAKDVLLEENSFAPADRVVRLAH
jgi:hypothetical protein